MKALRTKFAVSVLQTS